MPDAIAISTLAPAAPNPAASSAADRAAPDSGSFDSVLQAGLAKRDHAAADGGAGGKPASPQAKDKTSADEAPRQPSEGETDSANATLVALMAYSGRDVSAALRKANTNSAALASPGVKTAQATVAGATSAPGAEMKRQAAPVTKTRSAGPSQPADGSASSAASKQSTDAQPAAPGNANAQSAATDNASAIVVAPTQPAAIAAAQAPADASADTAAPLADARARAQVTTVSRDASAARPAPQVAAGEANKPVDGTTARTDDKQERGRDLRAKTDPSSPNPAHGAETTLQRDLRAKEPVANERTLDAATHVDATASANVTPQLQAPSSTGAAAPSASAQLLQVDARVGSPNWNREFAAQVNLIVTNREPTAEIRVNPPQLGPVEVRIGVDGNQVSVTFSAAHPETRSAIENALPQLREMFADNGLALGNASVSAESSRQQQQQTAQAQQSGTTASGFSAAADAETVVPLRTVSVSLVDTFA